MMVEMERRALRRFAGAVALAAVMALGLGCSETASIGSLHWTPSPSALALEGPLPEDAPLTVPGGVVSVFRVEGFAGTHLDLALSGGRGSHLFVEGPLADDAPEPPPGQAEVLAESQGPRAQLSVELGLGLYRVVVGSEPGAPALRFTSHCASQCVRETIAPEALLSQLSAAGELYLFIGQLEAKLAEIVPDETVRDALDARLESLATHGDFAGLARFPTFSLRAPSSLRPELGLLAESPSPEASGPVDGDLTALIGGCDAPRVGPAGLVSSVPELGWGRFPDRTLTACQYAHSIRFAALCTALAAGGSTVRYQGSAYTTPTDLIAALIASGHTVSGADERRYADVLSLTYDRFDVRWPVWIDTGLPLRATPGPALGADIVVPMGASRHSWRITGPDLDVRIAFSLGPNGAAYEPVVDEAPRWIGLRVRSASSSDKDGPARVLAAFDAATRYYQRNAKERATVAAGLPAGGFGWLGVANDANAVIEYFTDGSIGAFPLLRAAALDDEPALGDGLDSLLRTLPHDADRAPVRVDDLVRLMAMSPFDPDSPDLADDALRAELTAVNQEVLSY
jgi:hypothetical protein